MVPSPCEVPGTALWAAVAHIHQRVCPLRPGASFVKMEEGTRERKKEGGRVFAVHFWLGSHQKGVGFLKPESPNVALGRGDLQGRLPSCVARSFPTRGETREGPEEKGHRVWCSGRREGDSPGAPGPLTGHASGDVTQMPLWPTGGDVLPMGPPRTPVSKEMLSFSAWSYTSF